MACCPQPTPDNLCLDLMDGRRFKNRRLDSSSEDWGMQGIYAIMEPGYTYYRRKMPILYVGRGYIGERLERHFRGTDGQAIGEYLSKKKDVGGGGRFELEGIKVNWIVMSEECNKQEEESFIQCVKNLVKGHDRPRFNIRKGNAKKRKK